MLRFRIIPLEERIVLDAEIENQLHSIDSLDSTQDDDIDGNHSCDLEEDSEESRDLVISSKIDERVKIILEIYKKIC